MWSSCLSKPIFTSLFYDLAVVIAFGPQHVLSGFYDVGKRMVTAEILLQ